VRVALDARPAVYPHKTGVGYYTWHLLRLLPAVDPGTTYVAWYLNAGAFVGGPRRPLAELAAPNLVPRGTPIPARWFQRLSERFDLPRIEWFARSDVLFGPNFVPPPTRARRLVVTVHDLAFRRFPETAPHSTRAWLGRIERTLARATRIIAVSESTRRDLVELYGVEPARVPVIPLGVDRSVFRPQSEEAVRAVRTRFGIDGPYILSVGGIEPRKNLPNLVRAAAGVRGDVTLVVAGAAVGWNPEGTALLRGALDSLPAEVRRRVVQTGYVSEPEKVALMSGAEALVYPSLYEGFGLPLLEAMACGTPVVTSDRSSLPEVAGQAAVFVDPDDPEAITAGIDRVLSDARLRTRLREAGGERAARFTWEETARKTAAVLREAASGE
jgi:glycosyltransferase involved in cell wall biosynthesis